MWPHKVELPYSNCCGPKYRDIARWLRENVPGHAYAFPEARPEGDVWKMIFAFERDVYAMLFKLRFG